MGFVKHGAGKIKEQIVVTKKGGKKTVASKSISETPVVRKAVVSEPVAEVKSVMKDALDGNK